MCLSWLTPSLSHQLGHLVPLEICPLTLNQTLLQNSHAQFNSVSRNSRTTCKLIWKVETKGLSPSSRQPGLLCERPCLKPRTKLIFNCIFIRSYLNSGWGEINPIIWELRLKSHGFFFSSHFYLKDGTFRVFGAIIEHMVKLTTPPKHKTHISMNLRHYPSYPIACEFQSPRVPNPFLSELRPLLNLESWRHAAFARPLHCNYHFSISEWVQ